MSPISQRIHFNVSYWPTGIFSTSPICERIISNVSNYPTDTSNVSNSANGYIHSTSPISQRIRPTSPNEPTHGQRMHPMSPTDTFVTNKERRQEPATVYSCCARPGQAGLSKCFVACDSVFPLFLPYIFFACVRRGSLEATVSLAIQQ